MADEVRQQDGTNLATAGSLRRHRRGRGEDESESEVSLLPAPPEVMSVVMLFLDGASLAQASCVSKVRLPYLWRKERRGGGVTA